MNDLAGIVDVTPT